MFSMIKRAIRLLFNGIVVVSLVVIGMRVVPQLVVDEVTGQIQRWLGTYSTQAPTVAAQSTADVHTVDIRAVVTAMHALHRWETQGVRVHACTVVDNTESGKLWSWFTEETKEVCADGVIIAGVDMRRFADTIQHTPGTTWVRATVPASAVFSVTIDPQSYTFGGRKGVFAPERDDAMWTRIQTNLTDGMLNAGCERQVTIAAAAEFNMVVTALIRAVDPQITDVTITGDAGDCSVVAAIDAPAEGN